MKKFKLLVLSLIGFFYVGVMGVSAEEKNITSLNEFKALFDESIITVDQNKITLNADATIDDTLNFKSGSYILELNGKKLTLSGKVTVSSNSLTVTTNNATGMIVVNSNKTLNLINGTYTCTIENNGNLITDGATIKNIDNLGTAKIISGTVSTYFMNEDTGIMIIENGNFLGGGNAGTLTISGGTYSSLMIQAGATTKLKGGKFKTRDGEMAAIFIEKNGYTYEQDIESIIEDFYEVKYDSYSNNNSDPTIVGYGIYTGFYNDVEIVKSVDNYSELFKKITTTDTLIVNAFKPERLLDTDFLLSAVASDLINNKDYIVYAGSGESFDIASINLSNQVTGENEVHMVRIIYNEPSTTNRTKVNNVLNKMKQIENFDGVDDEKEAYLLDDLYLINYLNANNKGFQSANGNAMALNFAKELISATNGSNIYFKFDPRLGNGGNGLFEFAGGQAIVYYDGVAHTSTNASITASHVLYIPSDTDNTSDAYIEAALKRIEDYLGTIEGINITKGSLFTTVDNYNYLGFIDETAGDYYFNIKFGDVTYKFAICKKDADKLETPKYLASDIMNNIVIKSDDTTIPLDTSISATRVENDEIEEKLGTSIYAAYDISLYSKAKKVNITDLKNGNFLVSIPVPEELEDKNITVYYINSDNVKKEYKTTVKDKIASFETDHFSTYILTEKPEVTPDTIDSINNNIIFGLISLLGMTGTILYIGKKILR